MVWDGELDKDQTFTPRDAVATVAMHAILMTHTFSLFADLDNAHLLHVRLAYRLADAMIEARKLRPK